MERAALDPERIEHRQRCLFVDDAPRNTVGAVDFGWIAVHICAKDTSHPPSTAEPFRDEEDIDTQNLDPSPPKPHPFDHVSDRAVLSPDKGLTEQPVPVSESPDLVLTLPTKGEYLPWWHGAPWSKHKQIPGQQHPFYSPYAHFAIDDVKKLPVVLPELFEPYI
ncbi:hypothetical protein HDU93_006139 [Gonapodya sp. JEL0774]|nr:hypothetical protein HDU93_006139 [Gonapodya sp. JEL0774]